MPPGAQDSPCHSSKHSKEAKSDSAKESSSHSKSTKESSSHKSHKKSRKKSKEWDDAPEKDKQDKDQPKSENPAKSESPPSTCHQVAFMHTCGGTSYLQELYSWLVHVPEAACLAFYNLSFLL